MTAMCSGAPPMWAGSPGTAISSMARWPMARPRVMFEGVPTFPDAGRFWEVCAKHKVNQFYTAPTAIRALMGHGAGVGGKARPVAACKLLGSVGEPINPEAWNWYNTHVGKGKCPIVDTFWQTETGGHMITPLPGAIPHKAGLGHACRSSASSRWCWTRPPRKVQDGNRNRRRAVHRRQLAGPDAHPLGRPRARSKRPISASTRAITSPATAAAAMRMAITGSPAASMT